MADSNISNIVDPKLSLISAKWVEEIMDASTLHTDDKLNIREAYDFDITGMASAIVSKGRIIVPVIAMIDKKGKVTTLCGNRRIKGAKVCLADPNCPPEVKENLKKTVVILYKKEQLSEQDILTLICDEGDTHVISRLAIVKTVWRFVKMGFTERTIGQMLTSQLARFTRNDAKANSIPDNKAERAEYLHTWFRGTLGCFIMVAARFPEFAREQFLLTHKAEDGKLAEGEKLLVKMKRKRVNALQTARGVDEQAGNWDFDNAGPEFMKLWNDYIAVDAGEKTEEKLKRLSPTEVKALASNFSSVAVRAGYLGSIGEAPENMAELDEETSRQAQIFKVLRVCKEAGLNNPLLAEFVELLDSKVSREVSEFLTPYLVK